MKYLNQFLTVLLAATVLTACKKDEVETTPLTSLTMVNVVTGGSAVKLGSNATTVNNGAFAQMALVAGENNLYVWPVGDSLHPYYTNPKFISKEGEVYSLFLTGTAAAPDAVTVKETIPYHTDSVTGIRFINLLPNGITVDVTRAKSPTVKEVTGLTYKSYTDFMIYPGKYNSSDTFQFRNAATGALLSDIKFTAAQLPRFANVTLVIRQNGSNYAVLRVNNDR